MTPGVNRPLHEAAAMPPIPHRQMLAEYARESLVVVVGNALIAAGLTVAGVGTGFVENLVFSQAIGLSIMVLMQLGRLRFQRRHTLSATRLAALTIVAVVVGTALGLTLASALLGREIVGKFATKWFAMSGWIALVATLLATWYGWSRARIMGLSEQLARTALLKETAEKTALRARLQALQAQIEPHFLFNTLATLDSLIASDPARARELLASLNRLLRATLAASKAERETLSDQFVMLEALLAVQAMRLGSRLSYTLDLPDGCPAILVPPMLLQPLLENALKHGIEPAMGGGHIDIKALRRERHIELTVRDTGLGFGATPATQGTGTGLANVRDRLEALYGGQASLTLTENPPHGVTATIVLPLDPQTNREDANS